MAVRGGDAKGMAEQSAAILEGAKRSLSAGRFYAALEDLGRVRVRFTAAAEASGHSGNPPDDFDAFWTRARAGLAEADRKSPARTSSELPAALEALAEAAEGQTMVLADASRAYARVTGPRAGFYYLGEARGDADWAVFCRSLGIRREAGPAPLRSIAPELGALQERARSAFQPPLSIDRHPQFIRFNATLKLAGSSTLGRRAGRSPVPRRGAAARVIAPAKAPGESISAKRRLAASPLRRVRRRPVRRAGGGRLRFRGRGGGRDRDPRRGPARLRRSALSPRPLPRRPRRRSRTPSAGPTPETSPIRQVCWCRRSWRNTRGRRASSAKLRTSALADGFGVTRYPAVFVDDVLVAPAGLRLRRRGEPRPICPWRNAASQAKFKTDLSRMIDLVLAESTKARERVARGGSRRGHRLDAFLFRHRLRRSPRSRRRFRRPRRRRGVLGDVVPALPIDARLARDAAGNTGALPSSRSPSSRRSLPREHSQRRSAQASGGR